MISHFISLFTFLSFLGMNCIEIVHDFLSFFLTGIRAIKMIGQKKANKQKIASYFIFAIAPHRLFYCLSYFFFSRLIFLLKMSIHLSHTQTHIKIYCIFLYTYAFFFFLPCLLLKGKVKVTL